MTPVSHPALAAACRRGGLNACGARPGRWGIVPGRQGEPHATVSPADQATLNPPDAGRTPRSAALDVLRALAVLLVIGRHAVMPTLPWSRPAESLLSAWSRGGWIGVDLFFVLSGFLVSGLLFREYRTHGSVTVARFLVRRAFKIYPAFYVFLAITVATRLLGGPGPLSRRGLACEALFVQNYGPALLPHTWSLAVEEHFYLLCALTIWVLTKRSCAPADPYHRIPWIFAAVALLSLAARIATGWLEPYAHESHLFPTHLRLDGLSFGVCLSYVYWFHRDALASLVRGRAALLLVTGGLLLLPPFLLPLETTFSLQTFGLTALYLGSGLLLLPLVLKGLPPSILVRVLAWIGSRSYSIYLWHLTALILTNWFCEAVLHLEPRSIVAFVAYVIGSVVAGATMAWLVELPFLRIRDRLLPSRST